MKADNQLKVDLSVMPNCGVLTSKDQKVRIILKDGEFVNGASNLEASYVVGQESLIVELLTSNPPTTNWDVEVPKQSFFVTYLYRLTLFRICLNSYRYLR